VPLRLVRHLLSLVRILLRVGHIAVADNLNVLVACLVSTAEGSEGDGSQLLEEAVPLGDALDGLGLGFGGEGDVFGAGDGAEIEGCGGGDADGVGFGSGGDGGESESGLVGLDEGDGALDADGIERRPVVQEAEV